MTDAAGNRPAEIFGHPIEVRSTMAEQVRGEHECPFRNVRCDKKSRSLDVPFGVCSVHVSGEVRAICPRRFEEPGNLEGVPKVLEDIALHYFGNSDNVVVLREVRLPNVGNIDYVVVKHRPMSADIEDFVSVEFQSDSTTGTGALVNAFQEFEHGNDITRRQYQFGLNTYDSIKRAMTQLMNKGIVYEAWGTKCYWVIQEYIYTNLAGRYGIQTSEFRDQDSTRFALYSLQQDGARQVLRATRMRSTSVDEVFGAMRANPNLPDKDAFVEHLRSKIQQQLAPNTE